MSSDRQPPRLLVSVRNLVEATSAHAGGVDIIDIKEPAHGSLGMAPLDVMNSVIRSFASTIPLTAALGELADHPTVPISASSQLAGLWLVKVGTSRIDQPSRAFDRFRRWTDFLEGVTSLIPATYADHTRCGGIDPKIGLDWALQAGSPALLIDTFVKDGRRLTDWMDHASLRDIAARCHEAGILLALAGSLRAQEMESIAHINPGIWAVRGAVCDDENRHGSVVSERVQVLAQQIKRHPARPSART